MEINTSSIDCDLTHFSIVKIELKIHFCRKYQCSEARESKRVFLETTLWSLGPFFQTGSNIEEYYQIFSV